MDSGRKKRIGIFALVFFALEKAATSEYFKCDFGLGEPVTSFGVLAGFYVKGF
jgi:hypothetical protein